MCRALRRGPRAAGSARELEPLDRLGVFLVPLDHRGEWFRHHRLLRRELASDSPRPSRSSCPCSTGAPRPGSRRTRTPRAPWTMRAGPVRPTASCGSSRGRARRARFGARPGSRGLARAHGRGPRSAQTRSRRCSRPACTRIRAGSAGDALARRRREGPGARPVTVARPARARILLVRAALCADGADKMLADAERGLAGSAARSVVRLRAAAPGDGQALIGEPGPADAILSRAVHAAERPGATESLGLALSERATSEALAHEPTRPAFWREPSRSSARASRPLRHRRAGDLRAGATPTRPLSDAPTSRPGAGPDSRLTSALPWLPSRRGSSSRRHS